MIVKEEKLLYDFVKSNISSHNKYCTSCFWLGGSLVSFYCGEFKEPLKKEKDLALKCIRCKTIFPPKVFKSDCGVLS